MTHVLFICIKILQKLKKIFNEDLGNFCDQFVNNKLSIHFGDDKTNSILFASKQRAKNICKLNIRYKEIAQVMYLRRVLDQSLSAEPTALKVINKINGELKFGYRKNKLHQKYSESFEMYLFSHILTMCTQLVPKSC